MKLTGFILLLALGAAALPAATRPVTKEALAAALQRGGLPPAEIAETIRSAGAAFALSPADEQELQGLGADAAVLDAVRQSRVPGNIRGAARPLAPVELLLKLYHGNPATATAAVKLRGAGFALTQALETQLMDAGADKALLGLVALRRLEIEPVPAAQPQPSPAPAAAVPTASAAPAAGPRPIRVDPVVQARKLVKKAEAEFPQLAFRARMSGQVVMEALVGRDGRVRRTRVIRGEQVFAEAAQEAVRRYIYKPTFLDEQAVDVITEVTIDFDLAKAELGMKN